MRKVLLAPSIAVLSALSLLSLAAGFATSSPADASARAVASSKDTYRPPSICDTSSASASGASAPTCTAWRPVDAWTGRPYAVMTASFVANPHTPGVVAYAAWIRTSRTDLALYPGYKGPGQTPLSRGPQMVPPSATSDLLAAFNSGFYETDGAAGFYTHRTLYFPMVKGLATVVRYTSGAVDVINWTGGARPSVGVQMARQNLALLVNNSRATPLSGDNSKWGLTLHGVPDVWRTALGVDAMGNLIYVAAPAQTASSLAAILLRLHVVRAMELDINPEWPIFVTYAARGALGPSLFVPNPNQVPNRFLYSSTKDFFAVFVTSHRGEAQPW
jgi:hypothetical protein